MNVHALVAKVAAYRGVEESAHLAAVPVVVDRHQFLPLIGRHSALGAFVLGLIAFAFSLALAFVALALALRLLLGSIPIGDNGLEVILADQLVIALPLLTCRALRQSGIVPLRHARRGGRWVRCTASSHTVPIPA